jgi:hypothetical protein
MSVRPVKPLFRSTLTLERCDVLSHAKLGFGKWNGIDLNLFLRLEDPHNYIVSWTMDSDELDSLPTS